MPKPLIMTYCGFLVDPRRPEIISIYDIAHALSLLCRYGGHVPVLRSVAQHSIEVAQAAWYETADLDFTFAALVHDASEAYLQDIVSPLKRKLADYRALEEALQAQLNAEFGITLSRRDHSLLSKLDKLCQSREACSETSLSAMESEKRFLRAYHFLQSQRALGAPVDGTSYYKEVDDLFDQLLRK